MIDFCAVLLAGGDSTRMGRDKAFIPWSGGTLLEHQLATLSATGAHEVFISARDSAKYAYAGVSVVCDDEDSCGPLGGV